MVASSAFKAEAAEQHNVATKHKHKLANKCTHIHTYKPKVKMPIESFHRQRLFKTNCYEAAVAATATIGGLLLAALMPPLFFRSQCQCYASNTFLYWLCFISKYHHIVIWNLSNNMNCFVLLKDKLFMARLTMHLLPLMFLLFKQ
uniref:Uncharacterized protein n=1 Tax=Glossina pallidipes TaxID=7398 RepID=A0A1A9ZY85_GLOPL